MVITEGIWVVPHQYLSLLNHTQLIERALDARARAMMEKSGAYEVTLPGATHFSFTDKALFSPIDALSTSGDIPARREFAIVRAYVLAFFNQALLGEKSSLLDSRVSPFQEVWIGAMPTGSSRRFKGDKRIDRKAHREKD
jgi:hypothetical protein